MRMENTTSTTGPSARHTDGTAYRDLNGNGVMDPYEDPRLPIEERVDDLLSRLSLAEKAGLMVQSVVSVTSDGAMDGDEIAPRDFSARRLIEERHVTHLNVHRIPDPRAMARWNNEVQRVAEQAPHGIPATISTDPRHSFTENWGRPLVPSICRPGRNRSDSARSATRLLCASSPTLPAASTRPSASGWHCTRRSMSPLNHAGRDSTAPSVKTPRTWRDWALRMSMGSRAETVSGRRASRAWRSTSRRRAPARRRGPALPLRQGTGLHGRHVRVPPRALPPHHRPWRARDHALVRHPDRADSRR